MKRDGEYQGYLAAGTREIELSACRVTWKMARIRFKVVAYTKLSLRHLEKHEQ